VKDLIVKKKKKKKKTKKRMRVERESVWNGWASQRRFFRRTFLRRESNFVNSRVYIYSSIGILGWRSNGLCFGCVFWVGFICMKQELFDLYLTVLILCVC